MQKSIAQIEVSNIIASERLSDYLIGKFVQLPSRKSVKKAIKEDRIKVNGIIKGTGYWVKANDVIELLEAIVNAKPDFEFNLEIIFEDDSLAIINKPAGLVVSGNQHRTIANALSYNLAPSSAPDALLRPLPLHRLDAPTSGLLLIAKTQSTCISIGQQFENQEITKTYHALAMGKMPNNGCINRNLEGKASQTDFKLLECIPSLQSNFLSLVQLFPKTGRTHQIRKHLASIGHPILGDEKYGTPGKILKHKGLFLAATSIAFKHPINNKTLSFSINIPNKFTRRIKLEQRRWSKFR